MACLRQRFSLKRTLANDFREYVRPLTVNCNWLPSMALCRALRCAVAADILGEIGLFLALGDLGLGCPSFEAGEPVHFLILLCLLYWHPFARHFNGLSEYFPHPVVSFDFDFFFLKAPLIGPVLWL